jgi:hypothetical protein
MACNRDIFTYLLTYAASFGSYEHCNEPLVSVKVAEFPDKLNICQLLKKGWSVSRNSTRWDYSHPFVHSVTSEYRDILHLIIIHIYTPSIIIIIIYN